jgi:hypothetical protein
VGWRVDGFAGADLQRAALDGAPCGAVLPDVTVGEEVRTLLLEEDPGLLARLEAELVRAGRVVRRSADPASCAAGEVVLVEAAFVAALERVLAAVGEAPVLFRLAPLGARGLPWTVLERIAACPGAELLLRLPAEEFVRQGRFAGPLADLPPHLRRTVEACSALLDEPRHGWIAAWRAAERDGGMGAALGEVADRLRLRLESAFRGVVSQVAPAGEVPLLVAARDADRLAELVASLAPPAAEPDPGEGSLDLFPVAAPPPPQGAPRPRPRRTSPTPGAQPLDLFNPPER